MEGEPIKVRFILEKRYNTVFGYQNRYQILSFLMKIHLLETFTSGESKQCVIFKEGRKGMEAVIVLFTPSKPLISMSTPYVHLKMFDDVWSNLIAAVIFLMTFSL